MTSAQASDVERFKEKVRQEWIDAAATWRKRNPQFVVQTRAATEAIIQEAQVRPGMRVLDLASGTGEPALTLATAVAPGGHITATDLVPEMLAVAEENARQRGLNNMTFQAADAEALPFPDQSFDVVTCRFGIMFFPNAQKALREVQRVLKPGGRAAFVAWGPLEQNPPFTSTMGVFRKYVQLPPPEPGAPNIFNFAQPGTLSVALRDAGFQQVREEARTIPWPFPGSPDQQLEFIRESGAPAFRQIFEALSPEQREQATSEVLIALRQYYDGKQVNFTATIVLGSGVR